MKKIQNIREKIYDFFHGNNECENFFISKKEKYAAYYTSMYLLQDTSESLYVHRNKGFSNNSHEAYIELWGVMQAIFIQQDTISELYETVTLKKLNTQCLASWQEIRHLRNKCAGHPAKKDRPKSSPFTRTFMGRNFGDYTSLKYEQWEQGNGSSWPSINLGELIDKYEIEAADKLNEILKYLKKEFNS